LSEKHFEKQLQSHFETPPYFIVQLFPLDLMAIWTYLWNKRNHDFVLKEWNFKLISFLFSPPFNFFQLLWVYHVSTIMNFIHALLQDVIIQVPNEDSCRTIKSSCWASFHPWTTPFASEFIHIHPQGVFFLIRRITTKNSCSLSVAGKN
jgi:hypothetical protein